MSIVWTPEKQVVVRRRYIDEGRSFSQIGAEFNTSRSSIGSLIKRMGINRTPTGPRKTSVRDDHARRALIRQIARAHAVTKPGRPKRVTIPIPEPKHLTFEQMNFRKFCAFPVGDDAREMTYCGHDCGVDADGKRSSYCRAHHQLTYLSPRNKVKQLLRLADFEMARA
jgi:hypothetical protein